MSENIKKWIAYVNEHEDVKEKIKNCKFKKDVFKIASENGFNFTEEELGLKVSVDDLENVTGGRSCTPLNQVLLGSNCY